MAGEPAVAVAVKKPKVTYDTLETAADKLYRAAFEEKCDMFKGENIGQQVEKAILGLLSVNNLFPDEIKNLPTSPDEYLSYIEGVSKFANSPDFCAAMSSLRETVKFAMCLAVNLSVKLFPAKGITFALLNLFSKFDCCCCHLAFHYL